MSSTVNLEAEQAVLGSMLIAADCIGAVVKKLREDDFYLETNRSIFETICRMHRDGKPVDGLTVAAKFGNDDETRTYLAQLMEVTPTSANVLEYVDIVAETGKNRRLRAALQAGINGIDEQRPSADVIADIDRARRDYDDATAKDILTPMDQVDGFSDYRRIVDGGGKAYTRTGFPALDKLLGNGLMNAGLYFLAARPGIGKTALALNIADNVAKTQGPVSFISLEMTNVQLMARRIAMESGLDSKILLTQRLTEAEYTKVATATAALGERKIFLTEQVMNVQKAVSIVQAVKGVRLVVIDHFTLFMRPHKQPDYSEYAEIAHELAHLAKNINAPVLCLIQLNRETENRKGRPRLGDLRGTGATEEDAAGVLILHRENLDELPEDKPEDGIAPRMERIYLDKNRFGETGSIALSFYAKTNRFREAYVS